MSLARDELRAYSQEDISETWYMKERGNRGKVCGRIDSYWAKLFSIQAASGDKNTHFF